MSTGSAPGNVESALEALGPLGRYTVGQYLMVLLAQWPMALQVFGVVFQGNDNPFRCLQPNNSSGLSSTEEVTVLGNLSDHNGFSSVCDFTTSGLNETNVQTNVSTTGSCSADDVEYLLPVDMSFVSEFNLVCDKQFLLGVSQTAIIIGATLGTVFIPYCTDTYGRRPVLIFSSCLTFLSSLGVALSVSFEMMVCFKGLVGLGLFGAEASLLCLGTEIIVSRYRGVCSAAVGGISWVTSCLMLGLIAFLLQDYSWRVLQFAITTVSLNVVLVIFFLDESMRWLSVKCRHEQVLKMLQIASKWSGVQPKVVFEAYNEPMRTDDNETKELIINEQQSENKNDISPMENSSFNVIFTHPILRKHTIFNVVVWFLNGLIYYALTLLSSSFPGNVYVNYTLSIASEIPVYVFQFFFIEKVGRRKLFTIFTFLTGISLLTLAMVMEFNPDQSAILMTLTCLGKFGITGSFNLIYLYTPELYPTNVRNMGMGCAFFSCQVGGLLAPFCGLVMDRVVYAPGLFFGIASLVLGFGTIVMPETAGRELARTVADIEKW